MAPKLRHWAPKDKSPLPSPLFLYHEMEAFIYGNYNLGQWQMETVRNKALVMAHYFHKNIRESYCNEHSMEKAKGKGNSGQSYESLMRSMHLRQ